MIREGQSDMTLRYIAESPKRLAISNFTDGASKSGLGHDLVFWASGEPGRLRLLRIVCDN